ncbi:YjbF family lipoprotein, partial [Agarivorans sp.]|uniref:YjbF family lipoprotein n=1 Tax=Agarivorans sp. TaxID=1872412 RepID=UPI003CFDD552
MACTHEYKSGKELLDIAINGLPDANFTEQQRLAFNYAAIYVKYGIYPKTHMGLAKADGKQRIWASADGITIVTRNGQIIRADGLPFVSSGVRFEGQDPFDLGLLSVNPEQIYPSKRDFASIG